MSRKLFLTFGIALLCFSIFKVGYAQDELDDIIENSSGGIVVDTFETIDLGEGDFGEDDFDDFDDENVDNEDDIDNVDDTPTSTDDNNSEPDVIVNPNQPDDTNTSTETGGNDEPDDGTQDDLTDDDSTLDDPTVDDGFMAAKNGKILELCGTFLLAVVALAI